MFQNFLWKLPQRVMDALSKVEIMIILRQTHDVDSCAYFCVQTNLLPTIHRAQLSEFVNFNNRISLYLFK